MNTVTTWQTRSISSAATEKLAAQLGKNLKGGEVIELISDLGGGKTTFVRGLAKGFGSPDRVASPTFMISKVYQAGNLTMHHFDFYRLTEPGIVANELAEIGGDPKTVVVIEWGMIVEDVLPPDRLTIQLQRLPDNDNERTISVTYPSRLRYLLKGITT